MSTNNQFRLKLLNVSCASCVRHIETTLSQHPNITHFQINFAERIVDIDGTIKPDQAVKALDKIGYESQLDNNGSQTDSIAVQSK